jgi:hypothetical protein
MMSEVSRINQSKLSLWILRKKKEEYGLWY